MANKQHLKILNQGVEAWNEWRMKNLETRIEFMGADLTRTDLRETNMCEADLRKADLREAVLIRTKLNKANLSGCLVYGISVWDIQAEGTIQQDLVITDPEEPAITVDNIEMAQFIYLLLYNEKIRHVINTITTKTVLILGRFAEERKVILNAIRNRLRELNYIPILFDFRRPSTRDLTETVSTLAHLARFIIVDLTDPRCVPHELAKIVPRLRHVPIMPIIHVSQQEYGMFQDFFHIPGFLTPTDIWMRMN